MIFCLVSCSAGKTDSGSRIDAPPYNDYGSVKSPDETTTQNTTQPITPATEKRYSFLAAGDNIIHGDIILDASSRSDELNGYSFLPMYQGVARIISNADI